MVDLGHHKYGAIEREQGPPLIAQVAKPWEYVGWRQACLIDADGKIIGDRAFAHGDAGLAELRAEQSLVIWQIDRSPYLYWRSLDFSVRSRMAEGAARHAVIGQGRSRSDCLWCRRFQF